MSIMVRALTKECEMKHPYADILIAVAEGKEIQVRDKTNKLDSGWVYCHENLFFANMNACRTQYEYRVKPATILINGVTCEAPSDTGHRITIISGAMQRPTRAIDFETEVARDAAYAALILPFREQA